MKLFEKAGIDPGYIILGLLAVELIIVILFLVLFLQHCRMKKNYRTFMQDKDGLSLEKSILSKFKEIDCLTEKTNEINIKLKEIQETLQHAYQKVGLIKYDAFKEMGGKLSFSLCLLDNDDNGFIMTSMHTREGCYTYVKEIIKGESYVVMAEEERQALERAKSGKGSVDFE